MLKNYLMYRFKNSRLEMNLDYYATAKLLYEVIIEISFRLHFRYKVLLELVIESRTVHRVL